MPKLPRKPSSTGRTRKGSGKFGPPAAINIVRFSRSLWPKPEQDRELCQALIEATFATIGALNDAELKNACLRDALDRAYEDLKQP